MSRAAIDEYLWLLDQAFAKPRGPMGDAQSVLGNLATVEDDWWDTKPPGCERTIRNIVGHVGGAKYIYDDHAFRSGSLNWDHPDLFPPGFPKWTPVQLVDWLSEGHRRLLESVTALDDDALDAPSSTFWDEHLSTRDILRTMLEHDLYHAGEINHLRSIIAGRDRWAWEQGG